MVVTYTNTNSYVLVNRRQDAEEAEMNRAADEMERMVHTHRAMSKAYTKQFNQQQVLHHYVMRLKLLFAPPLILFTRAAAV